MRKPIKDPIYSLIMKFNFDSMWFAISVEQGKSAWNVLISNWLIGAEPRFYRHAFIYHSRVKLSIVLLITYQSFFCAIDYFCQFNFRHHYEKLPWTLVPMHPVADDAVAAPIDPGIPQRSFTEKDFEGELKRETSINIDLRQTNPKDEFPS